MHDIFISYNSRDAPAVDTLAGQLHQRGLPVFLDRASLVVGQPWPEALEAMTGEKQMDASAILEYFAPLKKWLDEQNTGHKVGWN